MSTSKPCNSQGLPLFAQSLETQYLRQLPPPQEKFFIPQIVLFTLPALAMGVMLIAARPNIAQLSKNASTAKVNDREQKSTIMREAKQDERRPFEFYQAGVRSNMFSPPHLPKSIITIQIDRQPAPPKKPQFPEGVKLLPINPLQDWTYTGVITMGESHMALLENVKTKEGQYVRQGESFLGAQIGKITEQSITLLVGGKPQIIAKSDMINTTPLSANAPFLQNNGQQGQPLGVSQTIESRFPPAGTVMDMSSLPMQNMSQTMIPILPNYSAVEQTINK